jgi:preprotein translocase subunit SecE
VITNKENSTNMKLVDSIKESYNELVHKVSWPTRKELVQSAVLVLVASLVLALIVWLIDLSFEKIMQLIYGLF